MKVIVISEYVGLVELNVNLSMNIEYNLYGQEEIYSFNTFCSRFM